MLKKIKTKFKKRKEMKEFLRNYPSSYDEAIISWVSTEHSQYQRGTVWKILALIFVLGSAILGVILNAWTFSLAILAFAIVYYSLNLRNSEERVVEVIVSEVGIKIGSRIYPYGKIRGFWFIYEPPYTKTLNLWVVGELNPHVKIDLRNQDLIVLRKFLVDKIPEIPGKKETFSEIILKLLKI